MPVSPEDQRMTCVCNDTMWRALLCPLGSPRGVHPEWAKQCPAAPFNSERGSTSGVAGAR